MLRFTFAVCRLVVQMCLLWFPLKTDRESIQQPRMLFVYERRDLMWCEIAPLSI